MKAAPGVLLIGASLLFGATNPAPGRAASISEPGWGQPVEGLSVRLQVEKTSWELPEAPILRASVRNQGSETLFVVRTQQAGELEVDGVWYSWWNPYYVTRRPLAAGQRFDDIRVTLGTQWRSGLTTFLAGPGRYKFRFAVAAQRAEPNSGPAIRAVSDPVEVELHWPVKPIEAIVRPTNVLANSPLAQPSKAYVSGRVVDDETGKPITDFLLQWGTASLQKPEEITWREEYSGPNMTGPGITANDAGRF